MSVLIKGMEIPYCCIECSYCEEHEHKEILRNDDYEYKVKMIFNCKLKPEDVEDGWVGVEVADRKRQDWCPLVDVPTPHGRLIDADELIKEAGQYWDEHSVGFYGVGTGNILRAPTVIEGEA